MYLLDLIRLTTSSFLAYPLRSFLTGLGIAIGITAVILLTSIGEGLHQFVLSEFSQFGTNIITVQPGKAQTQGTSVGVFGSVRQLTLDDAGFAGVVGDLCLHSHRAGVGVEGLDDGRIVLVDHAAPQLARAPHFGVAPCLVCVR